MLIQAYKKNENPVLDADFAQSEYYGKVRLGKQYLFWKKLLKWNALDLATVRRIYRRVEGVNARMCCGTANFDIEKLILLDEQGNKAEVLIGEGTPKEAQELFEKIKEQFPEHQYGKPSADPESNRE